MKVVFMGTPDFAVPCLQKLIDNKYDIAAVLLSPIKKQAENSCLLRRRSRFWRKKTAFRFISLLH